MTNQPAPKPKHPCGARGVGLSFKHECSPSKRCPHVTSRVRAVSVHEGMKVGARVSPTGDLWWCVGCGGLFADEQAKRAVATPTWGASTTEGT